MNMTEAQIRALGNVKLHNLYHQNPADPIVAKVYQARMEAHTIPCWTESSGKEGWYE
jgi:hypothetical protein